MKKENFNWLYDHYCAVKWENTGIKNEVNYGVVKEKDKLIILFQASSGTFDWLSNFLFFPSQVVPYKNMKIKFKVHRGFWKQFDSIRDKLLEEVQKAINTGKIKEIHIFGYSLGGRLAMFCKEMLEFTFEGKLPIFCTTVGAPRGFCKTKDWELIKSRFENIVRFTNGTDLVPKLPFKILGGLFSPFIHEVEKIHVGEKFSILKIFKAGKDHQVSSYKENINK